MKIVFIADFFVDRILGGGELNNDEFCNLAAKSGHSVLKIESSKVTKEFITKNLHSKFIISNFLHLRKSLIDLITHSVDYVIYEHDHKYVQNRNPAMYEDYVVPKTEIVFHDFYRNAVAVLCQSDFHKQIVKKNLNLDNIVSLGGNLWSDDSLELMRKLSRKEKREKFAIMQTENWHKNTAEAVKYCMAKGHEYELIPSCPYEEFLDNLSQNRNFIFLPKTPETLSRIIVEARMMGMSVTANSNVGATKEKWFRLKGEELIDFMYNKKQEILNIVIGGFDE